MDNKYIIYFHVKYPWKKSHRRLGGSGEWSNYLVSKSMIYHLGLTTLTANNQQIVWTRPKFPTAIVDCSFPLF